MVFFSDSVVPTDQDPKQELLLEESNNLYYAPFNIHWIEL